MDTQYKEGLSLSKIHLAIALLLCMGMLVLGFFTSALILVVGLLGFFATVTFWSVGRYSTISVNQGLLVVGKEVVPFTEIDKAFGVQTGSSVLTPEQLASLEVGLKSTRRNGLRILGGSYGRPKTGSKWLVIRKQSDTSTLLVFSTRHPDELQTLLKKNF